MLRTLRIKNLGLVDEITLDLEPGYTTLTGETGAGKSMIIGGLKLILGERADRRLIRSGAESCVVEAVFGVSEDSEAITDFLIENGLEPCEEDQLYLKRSLTAAGTNRQFINHSPASLSLLRKLGTSLIDIHGPYDHQSLFDPQKQLELLDAFAGLSEDREAYAAQVAALKQLQAQKEALTGDDQSYAQQVDLLRFQTNEIAAARLDDLDENELEESYQQAQNATQIQTLAHGLLGLIHEDETALVPMTAQLGQALHELAQLDSRTAPFLDLQLQVTEALEDLHGQLQRYLDTIDLDPARVMALEEQINALQSLKRKYGNSVEAIQKFGQEAQAKLAVLESRDGEIERLNHEIATGLTTLAQFGKELSAQRQREGSALATATLPHLEDLGFPEGRFEVALEPQTNAYQDPSALRAHGEDRIEFLFGPNPGEPVHPLRQIASSGEIARVMLALKTVLSKADQIPLLVFDEVDANVGGETAHSVGEKMRTLGKSHQVICITHLAPVAAAADSHLKVTKKTANKRTITEVSALGKTERTDELARMLGGKLTAAKKHAVALLKSQSD